MANFWQQRLVTCHPRNKVFTSRLKGETEKNHVISTPAQQEGWSCAGIVSALRRQTALNTFTVLEGPALQDKCFPRSNQQRAPPHWPSASSSGSRYQASSPFVELPTAEKSSRGSVQMNLMSHSRIICESLFESESQKLPATSNAEWLWLFGL